MSKHTVVNTVNSQWLGHFTLSHLVQWLKPSTAPTEMPAVETAMNPMELQLEEISVALTQRRCTPTISQLRRHYQLSHAEAKSYLVHLAERGVLEYNAKTGRYRLSQGDMQLQAGFNRFVKRFGEQSS